MKPMMKVLFIVSFFTLISMFNALEAADVYVIGSPTDLPEYNKTLPVAIRVVDSPHYGYIQVSITQRSAMKGYCTNYPVNDSGNINDIQLHKTDNPKWTEPSPGVLKYEISLEAEKTTFEIPLNVRTYDSGAWSKITATLYEDTGHKFKKRDSDTGTAPRDENGNHIADGWENDFFPYKWSDEKNKQVDVGKTRAQDNIQDYPYSKPLLGKRQNTVDKETGPTGNKENGDGFTVFEEYRGFMLRTIGGKPTRFSPTTKEVGILVHQSITKYGTGSASSHYPSFQRMSTNFVYDPFVQVRDKDHNRKSDVSADNGWINTNSDGLPDIHRVYAVRIQNAGSHPKNAGSMGNAIMFIPCNESLINIYVDAITAFQKRRLPNYTLKQVVNHVIGHEVGHTVNLDHCPEDCVNNTTTCMMRPSIIETLNGKIVKNYVGASPSSYHYIDYDLAGPVKGPQEEYTPPKKKSKTSPQKAITSTLVSSNSTYTAEAGDSHTANFSASSPYSSIYWYVKSPSDTSGYGTTIEIDQGDGSLTTADFTYTFPSGVSGDYQIMAYTYFTGSIVEPSYTVTVSLPSSTTTTTPAAPAAPSAPKTPATTPSGTLGAWGDYSLIVSSQYTPPILQLTTTVPFTSVRWYILKPGYPSESSFDTNTFRPAASDTTYYPSLGAGDGDYTVRAEITPSTGSSFSVSCTITVLSDP
ncbi:MAG: hypothetical protein OXH65_06290 [Paracoccaceae bacterium]|nr:hypothetical protein [Paracoccaceae bacterium]